MLVEKSATSNDYLKGEHVAQYQINEIVFTSEPEEVDTEYGKKVKGEIEYNNKGRDDPHILQLNNTSKNVLIEAFGADTKNWIGKKIPIQGVMGTNGKYAIMVDKVKLGQTQKKL